MHFNNLIFKTEEQRIGPSLCLFLQIILPVRQIMLARCVPLGQVSEYKFTHKKSSGSVRCISLKKLTVPAAVQSLNMYNQIKTFQIILIMYILYMYIYCISWQKAGTFSTIYPIICSTIFTAVNKVYVIHFCMLFFYFLCCFPALCKQ